PVLKSRAAGYSTPSGNGRTLDTEATQVMSRTGEFTTTQSWESTVRGRVAAAVDRLSGPLTDLVERDANDGDTRMLVADFFSVGLNFSKYQDMTTEYRTSGNSIDYAIVLDGELFAPVEVRVSATNSTYATSRWLVDWPPKRT